MRLIGAMAILGVLSTSLVYAQEYPTRPVKIIVPFAAGGGADAVARLLGQRLTDSLGQSFVVENRPGAGGNIGAEAVAKAAPDGYTLLMASSAFAINPALYAKLPYDARKDFRPITQPALIPNVLVVPASLPVKTVGELVTYVKERKLSYASAGAGTGTHLAGELFKQQANLDLVHVPYKGGGAVNTDLIAGRVALTFATLASVAPYVQSGQLRALAMTTSSRWPGLPNVPTMKESGFKEFDLSTWIGLLAPASTPNSVVDKLHREIVKIIQIPEVRARFETQGMVPVGDSPSEFAAYLETELSRYQALVKSAQIKVD
ncbi:MAG: tripartite tricarboxylate transporter substrate binding protein [Burkholderiales bacterium]|mgnify:CR=1 FL=1|nr:tripartite tricarboxylate transporter substrate binding protein [Burkholderiales bacterium]